MKGHVRKANRKEERPPFRLGGAKWWRCKAKESPLVACCPWSFGWFVSAIANATPQKMPDYTNGWGAGCWFFPVEEGHLQGCDARSMAKASRGPASWSLQTLLAVELMSLPSTDVAMRNIDMQDAWEALTRQNTPCRSWAPLRSYLVPLWFFSPDFFFSFLPLFHFTWTGGQLLTFLVAEPSNSFSS